MIDRSGGHRAGPAQGAAAAALSPGPSPSGHNTTGPRPGHARAVNPGVPCAPNTAPASSTAPSRARYTSASASSGPSTRCTPRSTSPPAWNTRRPPAKSEAATDGRLPAAPNSTRAPGVSSTGSDARQARAGSGDGVSYGRAVVRRVCGHVARRLAYQRGQVCQERLAIEFPAVPAALPAPECHVPRSPFRREATITARADAARASQV